MWHNFNCLQLPCYQRLFTSKRQRKESLYKILYKFIQFKFKGETSYYLYFLFVEILCHCYTSHTMCWATVVALPNFESFEFSSEYIIQHYLTWECGFYKTALRSAVKIRCWLGLQHLKAENLQGIGNTDNKYKKQNLIWNRGNKIWSV